MHNAYHFIWLVGLSVSVSAQGIELQFDAALGVLPQETNGIVLLMDGPDEDPPSIVSNVLRIETTHPESRQCFQSTCLTVDFTSAVATCHFRARIIQEMNVSDCRKGLSISIIDDDGRQFTLYIDQTEILLITGGSSQDCALARKALLLGSTFHDFELRITNDQAEVFVDGTRELTLAAAPEVVALQNKFSFGECSTLAKGIIEIETFTFGSTAAIPPPGDFNRNGEVEILDARAFTTSCLLGPTTSVPSACIAPFDKDLDDDIDLADFSAFQRAFGAGPCSE